MQTTSTHYTLGSAPVTGKGLEVSSANLQEGLADSVAAIVFDDAGRDVLRELVSGLGDTDFVGDNIEPLLQAAQEPEDWRVGEAIAESYLVRQCRCDFPWPDGRDERRPGSSLPGADLAGFQEDGTTIRFAFGEVKTSSSPANPPGVVHGRHGLQQQLEDLRDEKRIRDSLVCYLGHRAANATWRDRYRTAFTHYMQDSGNVRLYGILVRDVTPHEDDLRVRVERLGTGCPATTIMELIALYLPAGSVPTLSTTVVSLRRRGGDS
jgi:hypothetical protein